MTTLLEARNITLAHRKDGRHNILSNFSLSIGRGEFVSLVGVSGSGKTTLLSSLEGFLAPQTGTVLFEGKDIYLMDDPHLAQYRNSDIGMVFQFFHLIPLFSACENVALPARIRKDKTSDAYRRAKQLLREVGLAGFEYKRVTQLSGGQQQRVAIARAMINQPRAILADEPTGNLDPQAAQDVRKLFSRLCEVHGIALLVATHDQDMVRASHRCISVS